MKVIAVSNAKGGVGKTSLSVHFADYFARHGKRALLVDLDSQAHATEWFGVEPTLYTAEDALTGKILTPFTKVKDDLFILPATAKLGSVDVALATEPGGFQLLDKTLQSVADRFDVAVIDCPPNLGLTVLSALVAADAVVAPLNAAYLSISGLQRLEELVEKVIERELNPALKLLGYVLFGSDSREGLTEQARQSLRKAKGERLFHAEVRVSTRAKLLPARHLTAFDLVPGRKKDSTEPADPRGAADYEAVVIEALQRLVELQPVQEAA